MFRRDGMRGFLLIVLAVLAAMLIATPAGATTRGPTAGATSVAMPRLYKNCTNLNRKYPHGLGKRFARDKTSGTPVRNFYRSTRLYRIANGWNAGLDRDNDGIACEKV
jgi:excalibur calcium-binding domain-containing protein